MRVSQWKDVIFSSDDDFKIFLIYLIEWAVVILYYVIIVNAHWRTHGEDWVETLEFIISTAIYCTRALCIHILLKRVCNKILFFKTCEYIYIFFFCSHKLIRRTWPKFYFFFLTFNQNNPLYKIDFPHDSSHEVPTMPALQNMVIVIAIFLAAQKLVSLFFICHVYLFKKTQILCNIHNNHIYYLFFFGS